MLDQLTDRCATMCLLVVLAIFYPTYTVWFQISIAIDIASHWMHLQRYSALVLFRPLSREKFMSLLGFESATS